MPPNTSETTSNEARDADETSRNHKSKTGDKNAPRKTYKWNLVWRNVIAVIYLYIAAIPGLYLFLTTCMWRTVFWCILLFAMGTISTTAGAHRLWSHNSYKASLSLRIFLALCQTCCLQTDIYNWVRDHRMHHKYVDTDADPYNASRGFFFSHIGWAVSRKHEDIREKGKTIYVKDIEADPVVMFQRKYYIPLMATFTFVLPAVIPWYFWGESLSVAWYTASVFRYILSLNGILLINSAAHMYGTRPYDRTILPTENTCVAYWSLGEGWHNYHHAFPWDYRASELKGYALNVTTGFIDLCAALGLASDLKTVSEEMVRKRMARTGENAGSHGADGVDGERHNWGWGDSEMSEDERKEIIKLNGLSG